MKPLLILLTAIILAACTASNAPAGSSLTGTAWTLQSLAGVPIGKVQRTPTIEFRSDNDVGGSGGCNSWGGGYERKGSTIRFGQLRTTLMACEHGMDVEGQFHAALKQVRTFSVTGDTLVLNGEADAELARFARTSGTMR
jgi:putative lipoprotein